MSKRLKIVIILLSTLIVVVIIGDVTGHGKTTTKVVTAAAAPTTTTTTTMTPPPPTQPPGWQAVQSWWSSEQPRVNNLQSDLRSIANDAGATDYTALNTDCILLQNDTQNMMGERVPPAVIGSISRPFEQALVDYNRAAVLCQQGIANVSVADLQGTVTWMRHGNTEVSNAAAAIQTFPSS